MRSSMPAAGSSGTAPKLLANAIAASRNIDDAAPKTADIARPDANL
jgi:hypothetical protein